MPSDRPDRRQFARCLSVHRRETLPELAVATAVRPVPRGIQIDPEQLGYLVQRMLEDIAISRHYTRLADPACTAQEHGVVREMLGRRERLAVSSLERIGIPYANELAEMFNLLKDQGLRVDITEITQDEE